MKRYDGRENNELRDIKITKDYLMHPEGSVLIETGNTKVICTVTVEEKVPSFLKGSGKGWITAEYSMLPGSTKGRKSRESSRGKVEGRTHEIKRLIGRALRSVISLEKLGEITLWIDCDVIQADGGTRTASITGAYVALVDAINKLMDKGTIKKNPINHGLAAISVGIVNDTAMLDLCYVEDSSAKVDMNVVMTDKGEFIEIQGTGEDAPFNKTEFTSLLDLAEEGINSLIEIQKEALKNN